jgi:hypothetical protein
MNTIQVNKVLIKHVEYFQGFYPIDLLPSTLTKPSIMFINLDKHYMPGSHWVAVCFSCSGYAEYFDSCGLLTYKLEIMAYLHRHSISWTFNPLNAELNPIYLLLALGAYLILHVGRIRVNSVAVNKG